MVKRVLIAFRTNYRGIFIFVTVFRPFLAALSSLAPLSLLTPLTLLAPLYLLISLGAVGSDSESDGLFPELGGSGLAGGLQ